MKRVIILLTLLAWPLYTVSVSYGSIGNTKHNLSPNGGQATHATDYATTACGFCHVAHGVQSDASKYAPLWAKSIGNTFSLYGGGETLQGTTINAPGAASLMCLSCHDGTIALGSIILHGTNRTVPVVSSTPGLLTADGKFSPSYADPGSGYSPYIGTDLTNDHPIGFQFPVSGYGTGGGKAGVGILPQGGGRAQLVGASSGSRYPLYPTDNGSNSLECATCHDPHTDAHPKFLRSAAKDFCQDCHNLK